ncbi:MAG: PAS-domain containing protein [Rubrivivax sp.]|nr:PAS-domain containing protein [Rubrivivax sp.]
MSAEPHANPPSATAPDAGTAGRVDAALLAERVRLYGASVWSAAAGQAVVAVLVVAVLWQQAAPGALLAWGLVLLLSLVLRFVVVRPLQRTPAAPPTTALFTRLRVAVVLSGAAWGLAGLLLFPADDLQAQTFLVFVLAGLAAGSLTLTAFDLRVAIWFAALALVPVGLRLLATGERASVAMAAMALLFIGFLALTGWRAQRNVRDAVAAREAEARRAELLLLNQQHLQQISDELARQSEALQVTLDNMDQGILSLDAQMRVNFYNRRVCELAELPESLLATKPAMTEIAAYQSAQGHYGADLSLVDGPGREALERWFAGEAVQFPPSYFRRTPAGRMLEVKSHYLPGGGLVRTFSDVTAFFDAQQRLRDSQEQAHKLALVASRTQDSVTILDAGRRIEWVNEGFTRLTGWMPAEVIGRGTRELRLVAEEDFAVAAGLEAQMRERRQGSAELRYRTRDGEQRWCAIEVQAIAGDDGEVQRYVSIARDISARRAAEQALRAARDEAERASRAKSEFLSAMSHELRTPLNAILGFAQLLDTDRVQPLTGRQHEQVQQILRAGSHLLHLINDVLDLARVEAGKQAISLEPVALAPLLDECLDLVRPLAQARRVVLHARAPGQGEGFVRADRTRLKQVLLNLLSNAIKYNREGGEVRLHFDGDAATQRVGIGDTGPGLSGEQRERLFTPFERLGAESGAVEGAGIGLALSRRMVELMHGRIDIDSEPGRGSTFWVGLARAEVPAVAGAAAPGTVADKPADSAADSATAAAAPVPRHVLYVEDNPVNVMLMEAMLEREPGVRLTSAPLPELGLDLARADRPDLILLDIQLPGMDGFEVLRRLRADAATRTIRVVAVSANAMHGDVEAALAAGFDGYLTKPLDIGELLAVVRGTAVPR